MLRPILVALCTAALVRQAERQPQPPEPSADTQAATRPADSTSTLRRPVQADILRNLLGRDERPTPIRPLTRPATDGRSQAPSAGIDAEGHPLLLEGTFLSERPGRLVHESGRPMFVFHVEGDDRPARSIEIMENQLLEAMERETEAGFSEFIISGEVTRYKDRNYLLLRKILRRVGHGNLGP
jgi:hypothetical protein